MNECLVDFIFLYSYAIEHSINYCAVLNKLALAGLCVVCFISHLVSLLHQYETAVDTENPGTLQPVAYHMVNRRYSEFLNLQTRMEEKTELRKLIKSKQQS